MKRSDTWALEVTIVKQNVKATGLLVRLPIGDNHYDNIKKNPNFFKQLLLVRSQRMIIITYLHDFPYILLLWVTVQLILLLYTSMILPILYHHG